MFPISPILLRNGARDGVSSIVLGTTIYGVADVASGGKEERERGDTYQKYHYSLDIRVSVMSKPWSR